MRRLVLAIAGTVGLTGLLLRGACGCSSSNATAGDASNVDARMEAAAGFDAGGPLDSSYPLNSPLKGWTFFNYDHSCPFFVPESSATLPRALTWEDCADAGILPSGIVCREMALDWSPPPSSLPTTTTPVGWVHDASAVTVMVSRLTNQGSYFVVADVDGAVRAAIYQADALTCGMNAEGVRDGKYALLVYDSRATGSPSYHGGGVIGGDVSQVAASLSVEFTDSLDHAQIPSLGGVLDEDGAGVLRLFQWATPSSPQVVWSAAQEHLSLNYPFYQGATLFFAADQGTINKEKIYTSSAGVHDFIAFGNDSTRGAADLGTDGVDMAWVYGSGVEDASPGLYTQNSIMTASFTTDATSIVPRRLRSEIANGFGGAPFTVGCGYAVRSTYQGDRIVRLSDGVSWMLANSATWVWQQPVAITCDEVFLNALRTGSSSNLSLDLVRVRLDSLGSGTPPD